MANILVAPSSLDGIDGDFVHVLKKAGHQLVFHKKGEQLNEEEIIHWLGKVDAVLAGSEPYSAKVLQTAPKLKAIARVGVGYDAVDLNAATANKTIVTITPGTNHGAVAEHAFCLILALAKKLVVQHKAMEAGKFPRGTNFPVRGKVLGIAGLGRAGKALATRALAFEMKVIAFEPFPDQEFLKKHSIPLVSLDEILGQSDYLSLHMPYSKESHHFINKNTLAKMKPTAFVVNTSRGGVINTVDLQEALEKGVIAGAGLDVFEIEPPGKLPIFSSEKVVLTPHEAGVDIQSRDDMALSAAHALIDIFNGRWPEDKVVNKELKDRL
ncbi:MAG: hydroxyacid dehydrogenase [Gemmataceae bacterium]|nr:hydroxyacid dehydrogenase [Gemmataceae bacterium]